MRYLFVGLLLAAIVTAMIWPRRAETPAMPTPAPVAQAKGNIHDIANTQEFEALLAGWGDKIGVVYFHAEWCGPCKMIGPILEDIARENPGKMELLKIDVDRNAELAERYRIEGVPTVITFQGGKQVGQKTGFRNKAEVITFIGL